jgi:hypothetical protein
MLPEETGSDIRFVPGISTTKVVPGRPFEVMIRDVSFLAKYPDESVMKYENRLLNKIYAMFTTIHQKEVLPGRNVD